jgi:hypothetical protein
MVVLPGPTPVAKPVVLMVATPVFEEVHVAVLVRSFVLPSEKWPVGENCCVVPCAIEGLGGVTLIEVSVGGPEPAPPLLPLHAARHSSVKTADNAQTTCLYRRLIAALSEGWT